MNRFIHVSTCGFALVMTVAFGALSESGSCPTLTTANLAEAACSTKTNLFKTDPAGLFGYYADPVCPWGMKTKKWLQSWTSSAKSYEPAITSHTDGQVRCQYGLPNTGWEEYLNRKIFVVSTTIDTPDLANYWLKQPLCPNLTVTNVFNIVKNPKDGLKITVKDGDKNLVLTFFDSLELEVQRLKGRDLPEGDLQGEAGKIQKHLEAKCAYTYKGSDKENATTFTLITKWPEEQD